jgi:PAS domain S-box-containing protein
MNPNAENGSLFNESSGGAPIPVYLANFVKIAFNAVIGFDSKERITFWNPAAEQLYGWKASEVLGKASAELFEPVSTPEAQENQRQRLIDLERGATVRGEYSPRRKDGSLISIEYTARAILAEDGGLSGYVAVHRDISARKQADEKISRLNAELQTQLDEINSLMEILPIGIWTGNNDCSVITGNPAAYRIMGITPGINVSLSNPEPEMPLGLRIFVDGVEVAPEDAPMQTVARTGKPMYNFEHEFLFADQTRKTFYASIAPVFDQHGAVQKVIAAYVDFTERKQAEEQLRLAREYAEQTTDRIARLQKVTAALSKALTPEQVAEVVVNQGVPALGAVSGTMMLITEDGQSLQMVQSAAPESLTRPYKRFSLSLNVPAADAARSGQPVWIESRQQYLERYPHLAEQIVTWGNQAAVAIPMVVEERTLGVMTLSFKKVLPNTSDNLGFALTIARQGGQALERARLYQAELHARQAAERAADRTNRLQQVTAALTRAPTSAKLAEAVIQQGLLAVGASAGILVELIHKDQELRTIAELGYPADGVATEPIPLSAATPLSDCIRTGQAVWIRSHEEFTALYPSLAEPRRNSGNGATASFPLTIGDRSLGALAFSFAEKREFDREEREFFLAVAQQCAQGLERARAEDALRESEKQLQILNESLERKVREQTKEVRQLASDLTKAEQRERHRIAHILHEDLQQRIYAIQMQVEFLADGLKRENAALQKDFFKIRKQLSEVMALTRYLSVDLSPPILRDEGLTQAIEWLASQIQEQHGLQIELQAEDSFAIPDEDTQMLLFSCVRELLFNVVKHAGVNEAMVSLRQVNDDFRIEVRDQGKGFDVAALAWHANNNGDEDELQYRSFGLPTLRHRLSLFGGQMDIQSEKDAGTLVTITIPVSK